MQVNGWSLQNNWRQNIGLEEIQGNFPRSIQINVTFSIDAVQVAEKGEGHERL